MVECMRRHYSKPCLAQRANPASDPTLDGKWLVHWDGLIGDSISPFAVGVGRGCEGDLPFGAIIDEKLMVGLW